MKILALMTDAYGNNGGIAQYSRDFLKTLSLNDGIQEVTLLTRVSQFLADRMQIPDKIKWVREGVNSRFGFLVQWGRILFSRQSYQVIVCGHLYLLPFAWLIKMFRQGSPKLIVFLYGIEAWNPRWKLFQKVCLKKTDFIISISRFTERKFLKWSPESTGKTLLLPCSVNLKQFYFLEKRNAPLEEKFKLAEKKVIMTVGRLDSFERKKGFDEVLEVLPNLLKSIPNLIYLIIGNGPDKKRLESKTKKLGIEQHVIFAGAISEAEKPQYYSLADVYAMPSSGEGFGIVILEALASGLPVVGSKLDGTREALLDGRLGQLVDPGSREELERAIFRALSSEKKNTNWKLLEKFSSESFEKNTQEILNKVITR